MTSIIIQNFSGIAPKVDDKMLAENMAQTAHDVDLGHSDLRGFPQGLDQGLNAGSSTWKSMYFYRGLTWIGSDDIVEYAEPPIINDSLYARLVVTDRNTYPKVYTLGTYYRLGLPAPAATTVPTPTNIPADPSDVNAETVSYVVTYVDAFGNEGPPSNPTISVTRVRDTEVNLTSIPVAPSGDYNFGPGSLVRIYRSNAGSDASAYQFVKEIDLGTTFTPDNVAGADLQEVLPSNGWTAPPDDDTSKWPEPMRGIISLPNGMMAGFSERTLVFNEPYLIHAWPVDYAITFDEPIVNICAIAAGVLVVTRRQPYLVSGVHPSAMAVQQLDIKEPCVSEKSLVDMGEYAMYASPEGLVAVYGTEAELVTKDMLTRDQWSVDYDRLTIRGYGWEGKYVGFSDSGTPFIFDPSESTKAFSTLSQDYEAASSFYKGDHQLFVKVNGNTTILKFGRDYSPRNSYTWKSKKFVSPQALNFSTIKVEVEDADYSDITVKVYGDGTLRDTIDCNAIGMDRTTPYTRLSAGRRCKTWEVEITGTSTVTMVGLFESMSEVI